MKKQIVSHILFIVTLGSCNQFFAMETKNAPLFTITRIMEIEPDEYALDRRKPTIKNISFIGQNVENLHIYEATQIKRNKELTIILHSSNKLNYGEWQTNTSPLFMDVYNPDTHKQMFFKYISPSAESVSNPIIPPIYRSIERSPDGTTTFIKAYPVTKQEQIELPKNIRPYVSVDTLEDSDSLLERESDDDFLDQLAAQQKRQKKNTPLTTSHSFLAPLIVVSTGFIALMVMLYKSDHLAESFTQFFNTLFKNPQLQ